MPVLELDSKNSIFYEYSPPINNGVTLIFVNALTGSTGTWKGLITEKIVEDGNGYLIYNFRGQEKSKFDPNLELDTELIISDLISIFNHLNPTRPVLVGLSIGGLYAALAIDRGVKAEGLVLINTLRKANQRLNWINQTMVNVAAYGGTALLMDFNMPMIAGPALLDKMEPNALNPSNYKPLDPQSGIFKLMRGSLSADWSFLWSRLKCPTLVMTGHLDRVFRVPEDIDQFASQIANVMRVEFPDSGHLIPLECPEEFMSEINVFVEQL